MKRLSLGAGAFLCLVTLAVAVLTTPSQAQTPVAAPSAGSAPARENSISNMVVAQGADGRWQASFDYVYSGESPPALIRIELFPGDHRAPPPAAGRVPGVHRPGGVPDAASAFMTPVQGRHQASIEIMRPVHTRDPLVTTHLTIELRSRDQVLVQQRIEQRIEWPDLNTWMMDRQWGRMSNDEMLKRAIHDISSGGDPGSLRQARQLIERVLAKDPRCDQCYLELARIAMKSNWGPEGLRQAESYIATARELRPDGANAKILLGYVYTHQGRFAEAEPLLVDAARSNPPNNWLWANWGELLVMQGRTAQGIEKYREAMKRPASAEGFDYARHDAYQKLLVLLGQKNDLDGVEALYRQRAGESQAGTCESFGYANFMLSQRRNGAKARELLEQEVARGCNASGVRTLLGMTYTPGMPPASLRAMSCCTKRASTCRLACNWSMRWLRPITPCRRCGPCWNGVKSSNSSTTNR